MLNDCPQVSFSGRGQHHWQGALFPGRCWEKGAQGELCLLGAESPATTSGIQSVPNVGTPSVGPALVQGSPLGAIHGPSCISAEVWPYGQLCLCGHMAAFCCCPGHLSVHSAALNDKEAPFPGDLLPGGGPSRITRLGQDPFAPRLG